MKVLHVVPTYLPAFRYGGPIQTVHGLNKWLVRAGASVTVLTTAIDGEKDLDVPLGVPVDRDGVKVFYFKPAWPRGWFYAPGMRRALHERARGADIVHITSTFLSASALGSRAARAAGKPYLISPRGSLMRIPLEKRSRWKKGLYIKLIERGNLAHADAIHFTTEMERQEYESVGLPLRPAIVIPNGLDPDTLPRGEGAAFRKKHGIAANKKIVLFLGRLSWKKGLDTLIPAFAATARMIPEALLVLAGGDDEHYQPVVERLVEGSGIRDKVRFVGPLEGKDRSSAYQAASVFALSSYAENFAVTVAEAMHFGVPVVVSEEVGIASWVRRADAGIVAPKDNTKFAEALVEILRDHARGREMGERGKAMVAKELTYASVARRFLDAYEDIIQSHRPA